MSDKRTTILNAATLLFSEKGFHATSIQEVADRSHVSKGTIYTYFSSKEDLLLSIFEFFQENIRNHLEEAFSSNLPVMEKYVKQIQILLSESLKYKAFFKMQHREQLISSHKAIQAYLRRSRLDQFKWYESMLREVYGEAIEPYVPDFCILLDSLVTGFLRIIMLEAELASTEEVARYITKRVDNMVQALIQTKEPALLPANIIDRFRSSFLRFDLESETDVEKILSQMEAELSALSLSPEQRKELENSLHFLAQELNQDPPKKFLFKGLLSNFSEFEAMTPYRKRIEQLLDL